MGVGVGLCFGMGELEGVAQLRPSLHYRACLPECGVGTRRGLALPSTSTFGIDGAAKASGARISLLVSNVEVEDWSIVVGVEPGKVVIAANKHLCAAIALTKR